MSLIACKACQTQISSEAINCPSCGHPNKAPAVKHTLGFYIGMFFLCIFGFSWLVNAIAQAIDPSPVETQPVQSSTPVQPDRPVSKSCTELAEEVSKLGLVRRGSLPNLLVDKKFTYLTFDQQKGIAECLGHYIADSQDQTTNLVFINQASGVTYGILRNGVYRLPE